MKIQVNRDDFLKNLQIVQSATSKASVISVLSNVLIEAKNRKVTLTANNQMIQIRAYFNIDDAQEFNITVNATRLSQALTVFHAPILDLQYQENVDTQKSWINITHGKTGYKINAIKAEEFKFIEYSKNNLNLEAAIPAELLATKLKEVKHCCSPSTNTARQHLSSVLLEIAGKTAKLVATDGHRLALTSFPVARESASSVRYLIPLEGINELMKLLSAQPKNLVKIISNDQTVIFEGDNFELIVNVHNHNEFPLYEKVIPQDNQHTVIVNRQNLLAGLNRVALIGDRGIKVEFAINNEEVILGAQNDRNEEAQEAVPADKGVAEIRVTYNSEFFVEMLNSVESPGIKISIKDDISGTLVEKIGDPDFKFVVMPIRGN